MRSRALDIKKAVKRWLTKKENKRYAKQLQEKCVSYPAWIREQDTQVDEEWEAIARMAEWENSDLFPEADFVVFLASKGSFCEKECENIRRYLKQHPWVEILYGDEDVCDSERKQPWFKPDWSPDVFRDYFYLGSAVAVRRSALEKMGAKGMAFESFSQRKEAGAFVKEYFKERAEFPLYQVTDETAYRRWMWECVTLVGGFCKKCRTIGHLSDMWFSCESGAEQSKFLEQPWKRASQEELGCEVPIGPRGHMATVSVIIPSKDNPEILEKCIWACLEVTEQISSLEFIVVDNGSSGENKAQIERFIRNETFRSGQLRIAYIYEPMEFNFSRMCNLGASKAVGEFLLFLNDDVELCQEGTLEQMLVLAAREYTGAVGLKLLYPGTDKIQHAGITNLPMGPVHKLQFLSDSECFYYHANRGSRNVMAVTAACLMVAKLKFLEAGGFSEELRVAFNDVDFCFRLFELGYHNVCVNDKYAFHHESLSRGADESVEKLNRLLREKDKLYALHPELNGVDLYYSEHLNREGLDTGIRPGYITSRNQTQEAVGKLKMINPKGYRQDACLMVRVEDFSNGIVLGYGVVLGDNNACYEKMLVFGKVSEHNVSCKQKKDDNYVTIYGTPVIGQYRPDLEENMPDQINVALSGYEVFLYTDRGICILPTGNYRIGMAARNHVTGLKLINWTNRYVEL